MANITIQQVTKEQLPHLRGPLDILTREGLSILKYPSNLGNKADSNEKKHFDMAGYFSAFSYIVCCAKLLTNLAFQTSD
jgi:hypothetical protein